MWTPDATMAFLWELAWLIFIGWVVWRMFQ